ncbi:protein FAM151B-like isoform X2 [Hydractinia symbiolongicarpus]|nr:protein FAM151B-like isoform X2 [Hydractinia symbiolongicarpus]
MTGLRRKRRSKLTMVTSVIVVLVLVSVCVVIPVIATMSNQCPNKQVVPTNEHSSLLGYFNITDGVDIIWAHAVNSKADLSGALLDVNIMMLEADVILDPSDGQPIMAHPPATSSDITLKQWLTEALATPKKGIKLDFKQTKAISPSLEILEDLMENVTADAMPPILLNADIIPGPNNNKTTPVDANVFIRSCSAVENAVLSPGWTTKFVGNASEGYSWEHVQRIYKLLKNLKQFITFPIRASLASLSKEQLVWLINQNEQKFTLTVWTSKKDQFDIKELKFLRNYKKQVYYDLPQEDIDRLRTM